MCVSCRECTGNSTLVKHESFSDICSENSPTVVKQECLSDILQSPVEFPDHSFLSSAIDADLAEKSDEFIGI